MRNPPPPRNGSFLTAKEMAAQIAKLTRDTQPWEHALPSGFTIRVRRMPGRHVGTCFYLVWASKRRWDDLDLRERGRGFSGGKLVALTPQTAGKKARALTTLYGRAP